MSFDPKPFIEAAESLVKHDEVERALSLLKNIPAHYRDNPPKEIVELLKEIRSRVFLASDYVQDSRDSLVSDDQAKEIGNSLSRAKMLLAEIQKYNAQSPKKRPHVLDFGPGNYVIPMFMRQMKADFTYKGIALTETSRLQARAHLEDIWIERDVAIRPNIFVAFEVIEHLHNVEEIRQVFDRGVAVPEQIFLSTPRYTFDLNLNWRTKGLEHLRAYTPNEFKNTVQKLFPEFKLELFNEQIMVIHGKRA